jgi:Mg-chelatase subunit ChlD
MGKKDNSRWLVLVIMLCLFSLMIGLIPAKAQGGGPFFALLGKIDAKSNPPNARADVSVINPTSGRALEGLSVENFAVQISEDDVPVTDVTPSESGVAVAIVIDRGGIGRGPRREQVVDLVDAFLNRLTVDGSPNADMVGLIGIRGREEERKTGRDLVPKVPFTDFDLQAIRNEFDALRTENIPEVTPLYDGLDEALEWLTENASSETQAKLNQRRKIILVFSDGIDRKFSSEAHETSIIDECRKNNIAMTTIFMAAGSGDPGNLEVLAHQTDGLYVPYTPDEEGAAYDAFDALASQRQSYTLTFPVIRPKNDYIVTLRVKDTALGDAEVEGRVASVLVPPSVELIPPLQAEYTVPYSETLDSFLTTQITMAAKLAFPDGVNRSIDKVTYFANGLEVGASTSPPNYELTWDVTDIYTPTTEVRAQDYSLLAKVKDPYLGSVVESDPTTIHVSWEAKPAPPPGPPPWWVLGLIAALVIGFVVLLVMLLRTRSELARKVAARTTGFIRGVTRRLTGGSNADIPAYAKLLVTRGSTPNSEFRIAAPLIKVGRDPQFCDFALHDQFMSNPHFSIMMEQGQFFIQDEGSTNGTRLNGSLIAPEQRVPLPPDSVIEAGQVQLQFKRIGGATRNLRQGGSGTTFQPNAQAPGAAQPAAGAQQYPPGQQPQPQGQAQSSPARGGTTQPPRQP